MAKQKQAVAPQAKTWEQMTSEEKIELLGKVVTNLQKSMETMKRVILNHNHADGEVVGKLTF